MKLFMAIWRVFLLMKTLKMLSIKKPKFFFKNFEVGLKIGINSTEK